MNPGTEITAAEIDARIVAATVATRFRDTVAKYPDRVALRSWNGDTPTDITWAEYALRACRVAAALADAGVTRGDRVVFLITNRPEFHIADVAALLVGATPISIYNSSSPEQIAYLASHSSATYAIVENAKFLERLLSVRDQIPTLKKVAVIDTPETLPDGVLLWDDLMAHEPVELSVASLIAQPDDLATVIYTSGTTGPPKGVMLDHKGVLWTAESLMNRFGFDITGMRMVSYLPMAHIAERNTSHYAGIIQGLEVTTCPDAGRITTYLGHSRPQVFFAVPRVWEKMYASITSVVHADAAKGAAFDAALAVGWEASEYRARGEEIPADLAESLVTADILLAPWRRVLGLDECKVAISGAAPIPFEIFRFFRGLGLEISEIYGLSETYGPMTWTPFRVKVGTVGPAIPGTEVRLGEDGEVICRGGNIFTGYLDQPEKTAEVLTADGWFHTGDIGVLDDEGYLKIVDRKKELIITAGGKNISPANLEAALKASPLIGQACVIGEGRPFLSALLVLDTEVAPVWASRHGINEASLEALAANEQIRAAVQGDVDTVNAQFSKAEGIKRFTILSAEWEADSEELTPTMKLKRRGISAKYAAEIEALYL
ncbi:MAG: AMP-binding protein [Actinobacteria bacterium]|nr:AMP-binding protein [Actinomycetota bacterium]